MVDKVLCEGSQGEFIQALKKMVEEGSTPTPKSRLMEFIETTEEYPVFTRVQVLEDENGQKYVEWVEPKVVKEPRKKILGLF